MNIQRLVERELSVRAVWLITAMLTATVFLLDHVIDNTIGTSIFYLVPVAFATWYGSRALGLWIAAVCAALWFTDDALPRQGGVTYPHPAVPYWNAAMRGAYFGIISLLLSHLKSLLRSYNRLSMLKSEMMSYVAHEFGNQLAILNLGMSALAGHARPEEKAQRERAWESMARVLITLKRAVANFLNAARLESGKFSLQLGKTDLRALAIQGLEVIEPLIKQKSLRAQSEFPDEPVVALVDPDAISLVLSNLLGNAVKYTDKGGRITVGIAVDEAGRNATVSVADNGAGIPPGDIGNIFSGFYRAPGTSAASKGFGAGLKVSKDLVESHGARLLVASEPGAGSRFYFSLPLALQA